MSAANVWCGADDMERLRRDDPHGDDPHGRLVDVRSPAELPVRHIPGSCKMAA